MRATGKVNADALNTITTGITTETATSTTVTGTEIMTTVEKTGSSGY
jgi:hypothetical protein